LTHYTSESKTSKKIRHALDRYIEIWTAEQETEILGAVEFLDYMDESQHDRISRFLEELEQVKGRSNPR
jgi:hypothetical protein